MFPTYTEDQLDTYLVMEARSSSTFRRKKKKHETSYWQMTKNENIELMANQF